VELDRAVVKYPAHMSTPRVKGETCQEKPVVRGLCGEASSRVKRLSGRKYAFENIFGRDDCSCWNRIKLSLVPVAQNKADYESRFSAGSIFGIVVFGSIRSKDTRSMDRCQEHIVGDRYE